MHPKNPAKPPEKYLSVAEGGAAIFLKIIIQPRASRNIVVGLYQDALKVKVTSPPVDGEANKNLIALIAKLLHLPKTSIEIKQGSTSKNKLLRIQGITVAEAERLITK
jgi:hypothetical protein